MINLLKPYTSLNSDKLSLSYIKLRQLIGFLGILLPIICILGGFLFAGLDVQRSISFYYHTNMRAFFVGLMFGVGFFLLTYKGYALLDTFLAIIMGISGICIAIFPCMSGLALEHTGILMLNEKLSDSIHIISAGIFFITMAITSTFVFTLSSKSREQQTKNKRIRNIVYITCGGVIFISLAALLILQLVLPKSVVISYKIVLIIESIMLFAFGISWLIKGETLLKDS